MQKVHITDVILRDAHQSLIATRLRTEDMLPACAMLDDIGYWSLECWGGATFDACLRFLKEDPWERLANSKRPCRKPVCKCWFAGKTFSVIGIIPTMWCGLLSIKPPKTAWMYSGYSMRLTTSVTYNRDRSRQRRR